MTTEKKILVSRSAMAEWLGISRPALEKHRDVWVTEGDRFDLKATVAAYCAALRETAEARGGEARIIDLATERARLAKEQADARQITNAALRASLVVAGEAAMVWAEFLVELRVRFLALPGRAAVSAGLTQAQLAVLEREVEAALGGTGTDLKEGNVKNGD